MRDQDGFGSGCAALVYEIVWFQLLELVIGSSAISLGLLLATFMGGMCIGSLGLARVISAREHPLRVYAWLEVGIGVIGLLVLIGMPLLAGLYTSWAGTGTISILIRGLAAAICLLPQFEANNEEQPFMPACVPEPGRSWRCHRFVRLLKLLARGRES